MTTKCTGLMGGIFGHKWKAVKVLAPFGLGYSLQIRCHRCGAVTGDKK